MFFGDVAMPVDPFGGWISLLMQAGALGLLAVIVIKLFPQQQRDLQSERERRDALFTAALTAAQEKFSDRNKLVVEAIKEQTKVLLDRSKEDAKVGRELIVAEAKMTQDTVAKAIELALMEHKLTRELIKAIAENGH